MAREKESRVGRLLSRPAEARPTEVAPVGLRSFGIGAAGRGDHLLYVPSGYRAEYPAPMVVLLHGAGGEARATLDLLRPLADAAGLILLAPTSDRYTWDVIVGGYGPDVEAIDRALKKAFSGYAVDLARLAVGGFSDGASYALSLGLTNGDLFTHVIAFTPGFAAPAAHRGKPAVFVSHGTYDEVLPIERTSRRIVPRLKCDGYEVRYREFHGPHTVPKPIACEALDWFTTDRRATSASAAR